MFISKYDSGLIHGLDEHVYRADPALSTSDLKVLGSTTPYHFYEHINKRVAFKRSPSMELGSLFHMYVLERERWDKETIIRPAELHDARKKDTKDWIKAHSDRVQVSSDQWTSIQSMAESYYGLPVVKYLKNPQFEVSAFSAKHVKGIDCKCRIDVLEDDVVVDIKTTRAGGANPWTFIRTSKNLKYHWQEQNYRNIAKKAGRTIKRWYWAVVETEAPYDSGLYEYNPQDLLMAEAELNEAYETLKACRELSTWPGYTPTEPRTISLYNHA